MATLPEERQNFIEAWASMATLFSFSPSTARICGFLLTAPEPVTPAEIAELLAMSQGNVSMCLKELRGWGVAQRVPRAGDRRDYYESRGDLFEQMLAIARERKRREFDPGLGTALQALSALAVGAEDKHAARLQSIAAYLSTLDRVSARVLESEKAASLIAAFLSKTFRAS